MQIKRTGIMVLLFLALFIGSCTGAAAATDGISELTAAAGEDSITSLEQNGYSVLFQGMNIISEEDSRIYLGYKKGSDAITDLVVSDEKQSSIQMGDSVYTLASEINLNEGTSGSPVYLYYTKDPAAGDPITSLDTVSGASDTEEVLPVRNDGSSPIRRIDGTPANLDEGIGDHKLYLFKISSELVKPYLSNAVEVSGSSRSEAVAQAAGSGCDYYLDYDLDPSDQVSYIAYQRTADRKDALTGISRGESGLQIEKNADAGKYVLDLSESRLFEHEFTMGDWITVYMHTSGSISRNASACKDLLKSSEACSCVQISTTDTICAVYLGEASDASVSDAAAAEGTTEGETAETSENGLNDELIENTKDESAEGVTDDNSGQDEDGAESIASVISSGRAGIILVLLLLAAAVSIALYAAAKIKKKRDNRNDDEAE